MSNIENAIQVTNQMEVTFPLWGGKIEKLNLPKEVSVKTFNVSRGFITFIDENLNFFATPAFVGLEQQLLANGYRKDDRLFVFFSSGKAYPTQYKKEWETLLKDFQNQLK